MHGIYNYIPETNLVSKVHNVTAVLYLQSVLHIMLFRLWNVFCSTTSVLTTVYMCSAQCGCFLSFLNFLFSPYVAQAGFWNGSSCYYSYWYHFCFHITHAVNFYCEVFIFYILESSRLLYNHISVCWNCNIYQRTCLSFFIITDCDVRFVVRNALLLLLLLLLFKFTHFTPRGGIEFVRVFSPMFSWNGNCALSWLIT
jgi:hypothetical protein